MNGWARAALWTALLPVVALAAFFMGEDRYAGTGVAGVGGLGWAFVAVVVYLAIMVSVELGRLFVQTRRENQLERIRQGLPPK